MKTEGQVGTCRLCHERKRLLTKSHIIPGFMYSPLYSEGHRIAKFKPKDMAQGNGMLFRPHDGEYEANILCHECDNVRLGRLESYAKRLIEEDLCTSSKSTGQISGFVKRRFLSNSL